MKRLVISVVVAVALLMIPVSVAMAATTQDVTVTATPSYVSISNSPDNFDFGTVVENTDEQTSSGYFTVTNDSSVTIDISFYVATGGWTHTTGSNDWSYGVPAANTARLQVSSANGGTGGSTGEGDFDKTLAVGSGNSVLVMDDCGTSTNPTWELQLDAPTSFTHGDAQECTITISAAAS
jgi:hypothetical protein